MGITKKLESLGIQVRDYARIYSALSDEKRIEILLTLYNPNNPSEGKSFNELKKRLGLSSSVLAYHLKLLKNVNLVKNIIQRRSKSLSYYALTPLGLKIIKIMRNELEELKLVNAAIKSEREDYIHYHDSE
jgi:DNA-binding HxlR family transcriptional regulator